MKMNKPTHPAPAGASVSRDSSARAAGVPGTTTSGDHVRPHLPVEVAQEITDTLASIPGVAGFSPGKWGQATILGPGRRVAGIELRQNTDPSSTDPATPQWDFVVHIIADPTQGGLMQVADAVRVTFHQALHKVASNIDPALYELPIDVVIADIHLEPTTAPRG